MSDLTDSRRMRLRAQVISPLPLAVSLIAGGAQAETATVPAASATEGTSARVFANPAALSPAGSKRYAALSTPTSPANILPTCTVVDDTYVTSVQTPVMQNVRDNDGPTGSSAPVASFTQGAHGAVSLDVQADSSNGSFIYTPDAGFSGVDSFTYTISSSPPACHVVNSTATVAITVNPVATTDSFGAIAGFLASGNVLANDIGTNLSVVGNTQPSHGTANVAANGSFVYAAQPNFTGTDSFQYTVQSAGGGQATGSVILQVRAPAAVAPTPAASTGALGLLASLLAWFGLRRRRED